MGSKTGWVSSAQARATRGALWCSAMLLVVSVACSEDETRGDIITAPQGGSGALGDGGTVDPNQPAGGSDGSGSGGSAGSSVDDCVPQPEQCDGKDNDCDGQVDNLVSDFCETCTPSCQVQLGDGNAERPWGPNSENSSDVSVTEDGALTLDRTRIEAHSVWVANSDEGTVSKLDSETNRELARYVSVLPGVSEYPWHQTCNFGNSGNCPSRTAVDQRFDAYVANRAFGGQGTVTKYANNLSDCIDRNLNGVIDTSSDVDGDGTIDIDNPDEFLGDDDECILWTGAVGDSGGLPRALAIGITPPDETVGNVWVGLNAHQQACEMNPRTGDVTACVDLPGNNPYGAAGDAAGNIWFAHRGSNRHVLTSVGAFSLQVQNAPPWPAEDPGGLLGIGSCTGRAYGVTVDASGKVYVADSNCQARVWAYNPSDQSWSHLNLQGGGTARGVAVDDAHLWIAISHNNLGFGGGAADRILQYRHNDLSHVATHNMPTGRGPVGVGVAFDGSIWAINQNSHSASRLNPADGTWIEHAVGLGPYTYSDFIGFGLHTLAKPSGHYRFVMEGCSGATNRWHGARYQAEVPPETSVRIWAREAASREELSAANWIGPFEGSPVSFDEAPGPLGNQQFLEVEVRLQTNNEAVAPRVYSIDVVHDCELDVR
jgi:hypothetical protein